MKVDIDLGKQLELKVKLPKQPKPLKVGKPNNKYYKRKLRDMKRRLPTV